MPWTLYGYILREILKVFVVATVALVGLISFAVAVKPLSDGLLDPRSLILFVLFAAPTFVGFIVPFAGAFATTLVFHRMSSENEIVACSASGLSYRAILLPVFFMGVVLTLGMFFLSNWVVPKFQARSAKLVEKDMTRMLVAQVRAGRALEIGDLVVYADAADDSRLPAADETLAENEPPPDKEIFLQGVAVGAMDENDRIRTDVTARRANVRLYQFENQMWVTMWLQDVTVHDPGGGVNGNRGQMRFKGEMHVGPIRIPSPLRDDPKFLSWPRLDQLRESPDSFDRINTLRHELVEQLARQALLDILEDALDPKNRSRVMLQGAQPQDTYFLIAPRVERERNVIRLLQSGDQPVIVRKSVNNLPELRIEAPLVELRVDINEPLNEPEVELAFIDATVVDEQMTHRTQHREYTIKRSRWPEPVLKPILQHKSLELLPRVHSDPSLAEVASVQVARQRLEKGIAKLHRKIEAQLHKRAAAATACMLALLLGALMSMTLKEKMPLVVYFWTVLLSALVAIITYSGEDVATNSNLPAGIGLFVIWTGAALLSLVVGGLYMKLSRN